MQVCRNVYRTNDTTPDAFSAAACCFFRRGCFDMPAPGFRRKHPSRSCIGPPHLQTRKHPAVKPDAPPGAAPLPNVNLNRAVLDIVLPLQPEALFGPQCAVNQDRDGIPEKKGVRLLGLLATLQRANAFQCPPVSFTQVLPNGCSGFQVLLFLFGSQNPFPMIFTRKQPDARKNR